MKKRGKVITHALVKADALGPALPGTQHIAVGETTTGHQALEVVQFKRAA